MTWSYCSHTQRLEQRSGVARSFSSASTFDIGAATSDALMTASLGLSTNGRVYSGAWSPSSLIGRSAMTSPRWRTMKRLLGVVSPTTAKSRPHLRKIASASASFSGRSTISMRSWLSESIIS